MDFSGRVGEPALLIMISLAEGAKHGYAIMQDVEETFAHKLGPGTLYGAIARLESLGLIEPLAEEDRRRPYRLTTIGRTTLQGHIATLTHLTQTAALRLSHP